MRESQAAWVGPSLNETARSLVRKIPVSLKKPKSSASQNSNPRWRRFRMNSGPFQEDMPRRRTPAAATEDTALSDRITMSPTPRNERHSRRILNLRKQ